ncbi:MAG: hypothetical protein ACXIUQ_16950 [Cecembia sp.]
MRHLMKRIINVLIIMGFSAFFQVNAQGKFSLGIDAGVRNEKANFTDPQGYLFRNLHPSGTIGLGLTYDHNERWDFWIFRFRGVLNEDDRKTVPKILLGGNQNCF